MFLNAQIGNMSVDLTAQRWTFL